MNTYIGERLILFNHIVDECVKQAKLFGYQEVQLANPLDVDKYGQLLTTINDTLTLNEINKYYCTSPSIQGYFFNTIVLNRTDQFSDIENVQLAEQILKRLNIQYQLYYNFLGCDNCLSQYHSTQANSKSNLTSLEPIKLCPKCVRELNSLTNGLQIYFPNAQLDSSLVSTKLDTSNNTYKTKLIFEFRNNKNKVLISGGRLDKLSNQINNVVSNGFQLNIDEVIKSIRTFEYPLKLDVIILIEKLEYRTKAFNLVKQLRDNGFTADVIMQEKAHRLMYTRRYLVDQSARFALLFETKQLKKDMLVLKDLNNSTTNIVSINSVIPTLKGTFNRYF